MKSDRPKISLQSVPPWLRHLLQRSWLAGVISVGFHGVLFAAGPTFSGLNFRAIAEPELAAAERRTVPLIELSAAEQQRLPDFSSQSLYGFDDLESLGYLSLPPGATTPNSSGSGSIRTPAPPRARSPLQGSDTKVTQPPRQPQSSSSYNSPLPSFPINSPPPFIPSLGDPVNGDTTSDETNSEADQGIVDEGAEALNGLEDAPNGDTEVATRGPDASDLERLEGETAVEPGLEELLARAEALEELSAEEQQQVLAYDPAGTDEVAVDAAFRDWVVRGRSAASGNTIPLADPSELQLPYALQACLSEAPQEGLVGVIVNNGGKLASAPELLRSTGYPWFNRRAMQLAASQDFSDAKGLTAYQFRVVVNYDAATCVPLENITDSSELPAEGNTRAPVPSENPEASTAPLPEASVLPSDEENDAAAPNPDASAASETVETDAETATDDAETEAEAPSSETSEASTDEDEG